ncbi:chemotaxis protein CheW [Oceanococcus atlanticus]|nr:chemotaxis protein CheW [Oceanococcus atlanticus]RZO83229.1 MAG: chemotaxis protein CheW [Oceanococcus sp.]
MTELHFPSAEPPASAKPRPSTGFVCFMLAGQCYGVAVSGVREVLRPCEVAWVPGAPGACLGVINLRGHIVSVVDLRQVLGLAQDESSAANRLLVIDYDDSMLALKVDRVLELINIADEEIEATPRMNQTPIPLEGVVTRPQGPLFLLSPADLVRRLEDNTHV